MKSVKEFYQTRYDEQGNKTEDIGFLQFADGTIKKFWEWYNDGKFITVIQHRNRDKLGNYYTTKHVYNV